ncbi:MAG: type IV pilus assembly protein PilM [Candidatus Paceibacterota bacterium]
MGFLGKIFSREKGQKVLGVDVGSSAIKVVELEKKGGVAYLKTYGSLALGPYVNAEIGQSAKLTNDQLVQALLDVIGSDGARVSTRNAAVSIPLRSSLITPIEMPALSEEEMAKVIPIEARKYIPVPVSEVYLDWWTIPPEEPLSVSKDEEQKEQKEGDAKETPPNSEVLLVAIHNDVITRYNDMVRKTGIKSTFFEIEVFSTVRSVIDQSNGPVVVVDIGAGATKIYVVDVGVVRASHIINRGSQEVTSAISRALSITWDEAEEMKREYGLEPQGQNKNITAVVETTLDHLFNEANVIVQSYQRKHKKTINHVLLTGGGAVMKGLLPFAQQKFSIEVKLANPFSKIEAPAFVSEILEDAGPEFSVALGVALRKLQEFDGV